MIKDAVILAAGMGARLLDSMADRPKGFIVIDQQPIIVESIRKLLKHGIEKIWIVTGFKQHYFEKLMEQYPGRVQTIWNEHFQTSGTMYSLYCAREYLNDTFLLLESDIIYEREALRALIDHPSNECILMSGFTETHDEVFIETKNNCLIRMSKEKDQLENEPTGELVGIVKISPRLFNCMLHYAKEKFEDSFYYNYETDALVASAKEIDIDCLLVENLLWAEIDDDIHLKRAKDLIYPMIQSKEK